jgi:hypothetical protein
MFFFHVAAKLEVEAEEREMRRAGRNSLSEIVIRQLEGAAPAAIFNFNGDLLRGTSSA